MARLGLVLLLLAPALRAAQPRPVTLDEAYSLALRRSEELAQRGETAARIMAQLEQIRAGIRPRVDLKGTQLWQDEASGSSIPQPTSQPTAMIAASQPLFSGFREFLALKQGRAQGEAANLALARARQLLYRDTAQAYLELLGGRQELSARQAQVELTEGRIKELSGFQSIGRARKSELLAAQAQHAQAQAELETAKGRERALQASLRFLTGVPDELRPADVPPPAEAELGPFLERARGRADVEAARRELEAARLGVGMRSRQRWPAVSAGGNYYLKRPGTILRSVRWDASITGTLPLYWGGSISAQTREAEAVLRSSELEVSAAERRAELEVRTAHEELSSGVSIVRALENALALAEANAKAQAADYRNGLVTNLDVLNSLNAAQDIRVRLQRAREQAAFARVKLEVAAGGPDAAR